MFINFFYLKRYKNFSFMVLDILSDATDRCFLTKLTNLTKLTIEYSDCYGNNKAIEILDDSLEVNFTFRSI